jgi:hypothetical protein
MKERYERPDWVRRINAMALACGGADAVVPINPDELIATARRDFDGEPVADLGDGDWEGRLRRLIDGVNASPLTVVGRLMTRQELVRAVRTRLFVARAFAADPTLFDEEIVAPLVVTGPARSGTTILFELLGLDRRLRTPRAADVIHPVLPEGMGEAERVAMSEAEQEFWADVQPEFDAIHELRSDLPVECVTIGAPSFAGSHWAMILSDPRGWSADPDADMVFHRRMLQLLQHGDEPKRWLIKTPAYLMMLDVLFRAYPDARVIQTHRDPAKTMPSTVSTTAMIQWERTEEVPLDVLAPLIGVFFGGALNEVTARRQAGEFDDRFGDVRFKDLMADPVEAIERAYRQIGLGMTAEHKAEILGYLSAKPRGKHGVHRYEAADWGFDPAALHAELATYMDAFEVSAE